MEVTWTDLKSFVDSRGLSIQWVDTNNHYYLKAFDGYFSLDCSILKTDPAGDDQAAFEASYKAAGNKSPQQPVSVSSTPPFGSKTITVAGAVKKLYARNTGIQATVGAGSNTITYTATYAWAKLIGVEAINCEALDTVDFKVYDNHAGTYSGIPDALLNQFSYSLNLPKDFYQKMAQFDADIYAGMIIQMTYTSVSAKTIGINFLMNEVKS